jgi:hypothetical protein
MLFRGIGFRKSAHIYYEPGLEPFLRIFRFSAEFIAMVPVIASLPHNCPMSKWRAGGVQYCNPGQSLSNNKRMQVFYW